MKVSAPFKIIVGSIALLLIAAGVILLHLENRRLERGLAAQRIRVREGARLEKDNARLERQLADYRQSAESARALVRRDIEQVRAEIAAYEKKAEELRATRTAVITRDAAAVDGSRDPRHGPTRLEYFQNRGQSTPSAALETLVWAALKGDEATLADVTTLNSVTRAKAEALIAQMPDGDRAAWTPERLGRLWFERLFTEMSAVQFVSETLVDADEAVVRLRLPNRADTEKLAVRRTPVGWKVLVPTAAVDRLAREVAGGK